MTELNAWGFEMPSAETIDAAKARDDARDAKLLATMGLTRGQAVTFQGDACTVVCAMGSDAVMLHCAAVGRTGFVLDGAAIPVCALNA